MCCVVMTCLSIENVYESISMQMPAVKRTTLPQALGYNLWTDQADRQDVCSSYGIGGFVAQLSCPFFCQSALWVLTSLLRSLSIPLQIFRSKSCPRSR